MDSMKGKVWTFRDCIDTDVIIAGRYLRTFNPEDLAAHVMEAEDPEFSSKVGKGDIIVGGWNFGCGSSREQAPVAIKTAGVSAVIAKSFARIFYRRTRGMISCTGRTSKQAISIQCGMCMMVVRSFEIILRTSSAACAGIVIFVFNVIFTIY